MDGLVERENEMVGPMTGSFTMSHTGSHSHPTMTFSHARSHTGDRTHTGPFTHYTGTVSHDNPIATSEPDFSTVHISMARVSPSCTVE